VQIRRQGASQIENKKVDEPKIHTSLHTSLSSFYLTNAGVVLEQAVGVVSIFHVAFLVIWHHNTRKLKKD